MRKNGLIISNPEIRTPDPGVMGTTTSPQKNGPPVDFALENKKTFLPNFSENLPAQIFPEEGEIVAPGAYKPEYCEQMIAYFQSIPKIRTIQETMVWKNGEVRNVLKEIPNEPPEFSTFAREVIGISGRKLKGWCKDHPEFEEAYTICEEIYEEFIVANGLLGKYPGQFATFVGKNKTKLRDESTVNNKNYNMIDILNRIENNEQNNA